MRATVTSFCCQLFLCVPAVTYLPYVALHWQCYPVVIELLAYSEYCDDIPPVDACDESVILQQLFVTSHHVQ